MSRPCASSAFAFTNTSNAVSVPRRAMRLARRSSRCAALCTTANQAVPVVSLNSEPLRKLATERVRPIGGLSLRASRVYSFGVLKRWLPFVILVLVVLVGAFAVHIDWTWKRKLSPRGGRYFFHRVELAVPSFHQAEEKWRDDPLGGIEANGTLGGEGCAVAAAVMVFKFYGIDTDPQQLNWFLTSVGGYTDRGWLYWDRAAWFAPNHVRHVYEDLASYDLIDSNLARGNPVIVRVRLRGGVTHFVVIAGKDGFDYLIADPGAGSARGLYPLRELGSDIEALRFYEPIAAAHSQLSAKRETSN